MPLWRADLHVHTVLSACAGADMIPPLLVSRAAERGLNLLGIVDHNSAGNARSVIQAAAQSGLVVKPGLEVETKETVHLVCLFDTADQALDLQDLIYRHLPTLPPGASGRSLGPQRLVDAEGQVLSCEERPLFMACDLSAAQAAKAARDRGGLVIAAHVDRRAHGLLGVLGFAPADLLLDALEAGPGGLAPGQVASSDAHRLPEIGTRHILFEADSCTVERLARTLSRGDFRAGVAL